MYFDLTPGTPGINREDALRKLYLTAYDVKHKVLWGTDNSANDYSPELVRYWVERDTRYMAQIAQDSELPRQFYQEKHRTSVISFFWLRKKTGKSSTEQERHFIITPDDFYRTGMMESR